MACKSFYLNQSISQFNNSFSFQIEHDFLQKYPGKIDFESVFEADVEKILSIYVKTVKNPNQLLIDGNQVVPG